MEMQYHKFHRLLLVLMSALLIPMGSSAWGKIVLDLTDPALNRIPVVAPDFMTEPGSGLNGAQIADIARNDLMITGLFQLIEPETDPSPGEYDSPAFEQWAAKGAQGILMGKCFREGNKVVIEAKFFDIARKTMLMGKRLSGNPNDLRRMVHHLGDRIMEKLTGAPGCFNTRLAFVGAGSMRELHVMDYDGHNRVRVTDNRSINMSPEWSRDGRSLLFTSYVSGDPDLWSLNLSNLKVERISGRRGLDASARWSPDGRAIALSLEYKGIPNIFIISPRGNILKQLTRGRGNDISPTWSPDGSSIAYVSDRAGSPQIYVTPSTGGNTRRLTFQTGYNTDPDWSPRGDLIAFTARVEGDFQICVMRPDGSGLRTLTSQGSNRAPAWSPDGRMIAFCSNRSGEERIYVMDAKGTIQSMVSPISGKSPAWSPYLGH
jgi:TolB protein